MYSLHDHFFFYGTLIPEYAPEHLREVLAGFHLLGEGWLPGTLYDFGNYPGAVFDDSSQRSVFGRVYMGSSDDLLLAELDRYEGYDQLSPAEGEYIRQRRNVTLARRQCGGMLDVRLQLEHRGLSDHRRRPLAWRIINCCKRRDYAPIRSTYGARAGLASNGSAKYCVSRATSSPLNSMILTV